VERDETRADEDEGHVDGYPDERGRHQTQWAGTVFEHCIWQSRKGISFTIKPC